MAKYVSTWHSKVRYSERVGYRESMKKTLKNVMKYGVRLADVPLKYVKDRKFLKRNKIYYQGKVYIFAGVNQYHVLLTVYPHKSKVLEYLYRNKDSSRKERLYKQMFTTQQGVLYRVSLYKGKIFEVEVVNEKEYTLEPLEDIKERLTISRSMMALIKGRETKFKVNIYLEHLEELEKNVYKKVLEIKKGQTITYKELALEFGTTIQRMSGIIETCPIPIFIPTHRVIKTNGQVGCHRVSKEMKKNILKLEKLEASKPVKIKKQKPKEETKDFKDEYLCYSIGDLFKDLL